MNNEVTILEGLSVIYFTVTEIILVTIIARWLYYQGDHNTEVAVLPKCP